MYYYQDNNQKEAMLKLIDVMVDQNVCLKVGWISDEYSYALSEEQFQQLVKQTIGNDYDFIPSKDGFEIVNMKAHCKIGEIVGKCDTAYIRGDYQYGVFTPIYFKIGNEIYIKKNHIGLINCEYQVRYEYDEGLYVICTAKKMLTKCDMNGLILWESPIPVNYANNLMFDYVDYPTAEFPHGLISISERNESFWKYLFNRETGEFFGKCKVDKIYHLPDR